MTGVFPRAIIFDWDNTLVDSWDAIAEAINAARAHFGLPTWNRAEILIHCTRSARESFPEWFGEKWPDAWGYYYATFDKVRQRLGIREAAGVTDLLRWLKENGIPAMVVSNKSGTYLRQEVGQLGWNGYFAAIVGAHDAAVDKPAREHVDKALSVAGVAAGPGLWLVGDSEIDMLCARNAECTPVLIGARDKAEKLGVAIDFPDCKMLLAHLMKSA